MGDLVGKICITCKKSKNIDSFAWRDKKRNKRHTYCRECRTKIDTKFYKRNKKDILAYKKKQRKERQEENTKRILEYLEDKCCLDCAETDPVVLDFDHLRDKKFNISNAIHRYPWKKILKEIEKCVIRCSNCHRKKTARERGYLRYELLNNGDVV